MLDVSASAAEEQYKGFHSSTLFQKSSQEFRPNNPEPAVAQDESSLRKFYHKIQFEISGRKNPDFFVRRLEGDQEYSPFGRVTESPTARVLAHRKYNAFSQFLQRYMSLMKVNAVTQQEENAGSRLDLFSMESQTTNTDFADTYKSLLRNLYTNQSFKRFDSARLRAAIWGLPSDWKNTGSLSADNRWALLSNYAILGKLSERFAIIAQREDNWDGRESKKPSSLALANARTILEEFIDAIFMEGYECDTPFTSSDQDGYITFAWNGVERRLHLKIEDDEAVYVKIWRQNGEIQLSLETLHHEDYLKIWKWFLYG